ncbi:nitroreductase family protein [Amphiplicatus metriothermophilus]|uniref:nitroreductase family protein n=1 Tax=Amphiplicatus metriothermophilus TaxID=1519374 RepID=UPI0035D3DF0C
MQPEFVPLAALGDYVARADEEMRARARAFFEEIRRRHTVREFSPEPVPRDVVETCIAAAGRAPSGANQQPWRFVLVGDREIKRKIRAAAEAEERAFYAGKASPEWLDALAPLGTDEVKPYLEIAPWLIAVFAERRNAAATGREQKTYYMNESVGIATGFLIAALHHAGLATLTHTPNPMAFLSEILDRPPSEKPYMLIVAGRPAANAQVPKHALKKKALEDILRVV